MKEVLSRRAKELRANYTDAEKHLWYLLRAHRLGGYKFKRQYVIAPYIVDFIGLSKKLIIELDGGHHAEQKIYDLERTVYLEKKGFKVLRFWNLEVFKETQGVVNAILSELEGKEIV